jgi:hypothetical protein
MKTDRLLIALTLIFLTLFTTNLTAEVENVLDVIPADAVGVVYAPNLAGFNDEINALFAQMNPQMDATAPPVEVIAQILAASFGAGFDSLAELEELGFDLSKNFAVFFTGIEQHQMGAAVHIKDVALVKGTIEAEAEGSAAMTHNGMTYYTTGEEGAFIVLDDVLIYGRSPEICKNAIDVFKKASPPITKNADYTALKLDTSSGMNDLVFYLAVEPIAEPVTVMLNESIAKMAEEIEMEAEPNPQLAMSMDMLPKMADAAVWLLEQTTSLSLTLQLNGSDLQIASFLKCHEDSDIQKYIRGTPTKLMLGKYLPKTAFMNGMMQYDKEGLINMTQGLLKLFTSSDLNADAAKMEEGAQGLTQAMTEFYDALGNEASVSANFSESLMPDVLSIYDVANEKQAKAYMDEKYLTYLKVTQSWYQGMGVEEYAGMYEGASAGPSEMYNDVEIKSYMLPNINAVLSELPLEMEFLKPMQWNIYYAITDGKLFTAMASSAQPLRDALDRLGSTSMGFDQGAGYDKLTRTLGLKNNMLVAISPITAIKSFIQLFAPMDASGSALQFQMMLANIPETFSIGIASQNRDGGVEGQLLISIGDFQPLVMIIMSMLQMGM